MDPVPAAQPSGMQGGIFDGLAVGPKAPAQAQSDSLSGAAPVSSSSVAGAADMFGGLSLTTPGQSSSYGAGQMSADPFGGLSAPTAGSASAGEHFIWKQCSICMSLDYANLGHKLLLQ